MDLTPEERQKIYEEEKVRLEARTQLKGARQRNGCLGCLGLLGGLVVLGLIGSLLSPSSRDSAKREESATSTPQALRGPELLKNIGLMNDALGEMHVEVAGQSLDHMRLTLDVFNAAARLVAAAKAESLTSEDLSKVSELRRALVRRQRQTFPIMRERLGPILSKELWVSDAKARSYGDRFARVEFVAGEFAANRNIQRAHSAIRATLVRLRFKRAEYRWIASADEYSYYAIESPRDEEVASIDAEGNITAVP